MNNHIGLEDIRAALATQNDPWRADTTSMSSLPPDEQQQRLGVKPPPGEPTVDEVARGAEQIREQMQARALERSVRVALPAAFDNRDLGDETSVTALTMLAAHARFSGSPINYREESDGLVHEIYVW